MTERRIRLDLSLAEAQALLRMVLEAEAGGFNDGEMFETRQREEAAVRAIAKLRLLAGT